MSPPTAELLAVGAGEPAAGPGSPAPAAATILPPASRVRVFVSSTFGDLVAERAAVRRAVRTLRLTPVMFEDGARAHPPADTYRAYLGQSHVFVGVYGTRYGTVVPGGTVSGIEDEYERSAGMPRLLYVKQGEHLQGREARLEELLARIRRSGDAVYRVFADARELGRLVADDLAVLLSEDFVGVRRPPPPVVPVPTLPVPSTPTVARQAEIAAVEHDLRTGRRLVTVTGPGGVGKSRVALEVARRVGDAFGDGIVFVGLEDVRDPARVLPAVADVLGMADDGRRPLRDALAARLADRRVLLVVDNLEHLLAAAPDLAYLLDHTRGVAVLATSRSRLALRGERQRPLTGLGLPSGDDPRAVRDAPAVRLFAGRAAAVDPAFTLADEDLPVVAEIVRRLDGLPLAIELAAAQTRLFPPEALLRQLEAAPGGIGTGTGDMPGRHRSLASTLEWSVDLLDEPGRALFARLSVFSGGADLDAVSQVVGGGPVLDVVGTLTSLVDRSLVVAESAGVDGGAVRVRLLRTVRVRARSLLVARGEVDELRRRHAAYFARLVSGAPPVGFSPGSGSWGALERDSANLLEAATWSTSHGDHATLPALVRGLWSWLWATGRYRLLRDGARLALDSLGASAAPRDQALLQLVSAVAEGATGHAREAERAAGRAVELGTPLLMGATDPDLGVVAGAHLIRGRLRYARGAPGAGDDLRAALRLSDAGGLRWLQVCAAVTRALTRIRSGYVVGARKDVARARQAAGADPALLELADLAEVQVDALGGGRDGTGERLARVVSRGSGLLQGEAVLLALDAAAAVAVGERRWADAAAAAAAADRMDVPVHPRARLAAHDPRSPATRAAQALGAAELERAVGLARSSRPVEVLRGAVPGCRRTGGPS